MINVDDLNSASVDLGKQFSFSELKGNNGTISVWEDGVAKGVRIVSNDDGKVRLSGVSNLSDLDKTNLSDILVKAGIGRIVT